MNDLDRAAVSTLTYYQEAFSWPLTAPEVCQRLIGYRASLGQVVASMDRWGLLQARLEVRAQAQAVCAEKWRSMRRFAWWFQWVPYVRALSASGSLALGNARQESDWDIFVVARQGRLYTARAFLLATAFVMGRLRTKNNPETADRFCFNHWVTTGGLRLDHRTLFTAQGLALMIPLHDPDGYLPALWRANAWIGEHGGDSGSTAWAHRSVRRSNLLVFKRWMLERMLDTPLGDLVEQLLKRWMQKRIADDPATYDPDGRVVATERELAFHPHSFEAIALARHTSALAESGLTK